MGGSETTGTRMGLSESIQGWFPLPAPYFARNASG